MSGLIKFTLHLNDRYHPNVPEPAHSTQRRYISSTVYVIYSRKGNPNQLIFHIHYNLGKDRFCRAHVSFFWPSNATLCASSNDDSSAEPSCTVPAVVGVSYFPIVRSISSARCRYIVSKSLLSTRLFRYEFLLGFGSRARLRSLLASPPQCLLWGQGIWLMWSWNQSLT